MGKSLKKKVNVSRRDIKLNEMMDKQKNIYVRTVS